MTKFIYVSIYRDRYKERDNVDRYIYIYRSPDI